MLNYIISLIQALSVLFPTCFLFTCFLSLKNPALSRSECMYLQLLFTAVLQQCFWHCTLMFKFIVGVNRQVCSNISDVTDVVQQNFVFLLFLLC